MFIVVCYKDSPELSSQGQLQESDASVEKTVLVNPHCGARVLLEFLRTKCKLGAYTNFDLCDISGDLKNLFELPPWQHPAELFEHRRTYYIIVFKTEPDKNVTTIIPQVNSSSVLFEQLRSRVQRARVGGNPGASSHGMRGGGNPRDAGSSRSRLGKSPSRARRKIGASAK